MGIKRRRDVCQQTLWYLIGIFVNVTAVALGTFAHQVFFSLQSKIYESLFSFRPFSQNEPKILKWSLNNILLMFFRFIDGYLLHCLLWEFAKWTFTYSWHSNIQVKPSELKRAYFGHWYRLKIHIRGCKWVKYQFSFFFLSLSYNWGHIQ